MITRTFKALTSRPVFVLAAALAILMLAAPFAFAETSKFSYAENGTDPIARFSASDEDGDEITWGLEGDDAGDFKISDAGVLTFKDKPNYEGAVDMDKDNVYKVTVTATAKTKSTQDVEVTVTDVDEAGEVTLSQPQPQVTRDLEASGSGDPDDPVEDEKWQWSRGPNIDGPWTEIAKATALSRPPVEADIGSYLQAMVTYTDKFGAGKTASMVSENPVEERTVANAAPSFADHDTNDDTTDGVQAMRAVDEGKKGANVGKPLSAKDTDGDVLLYSIAADGNMNDTAVSTIRDLFSIDPRSGQLKTKVDTLNSDDSGTTADSETPDDDEVTYTITVTAKDPSGAPGMAAVTVTITDVNDKPAFPENADETHTISEAPTALTLGDAYAATDDDELDLNAELTYGVTGADASAFTIGNGEDLNDNGNAADPNEALGQLALKKTPDFETKSSYSVTVTATDDENATAELKVTVTVTNAEDDGVVSLTAREPQVGRQVVASLVDKDGSVSGASWKWYRNATDAATDETLANVTDDCTDTTADDTLCLIPKATGPSYTPVAADAAADDTDAAMLAARVTYNDKHVTDENTDDVDDGDSAFVITQAAVQVSDPANTAPKFADDQDPNTADNQPDAVRSVPENAKDESVGDAVTATDADDDLTIYTLGGADEMYFTIVSGLKDGGRSEGQIKTAMKLDYETKSQYMVVVTTTDPSGATDTVNVMINVTNEDDPPTITGDMTFTVPENTTDPVVTFSASDQDGDEVTWGLEGDDDGHFKISDAGVLTFMEKPNYEGAVDMDEDNVYKVTVTATGETKSTQAVEVTVTDVDEAGKVTLSQPQPQGGRTITAEGSGDPDAGVEDEKWQWSRGPSMDGPWTDIAKANSTSRTPDAADEGMYLRATVTYTDKFGAQTASMVSENPVEERTLANAAPSFADHDTIDTEDGVQATRAVDEGKKGANVGKPLSAKDGDGDVLLYSIAAAGTMDNGEGTTDAAAANIKDLFSIDARSGQLKTKVDTLNSDDSGHTSPADDDGEVSYTFVVTAKDPSGAPGTATVTVTITDVNDKPVFPDTNVETHTIEEGTDNLTLGTAAYAATDADDGDATTDDPLTYGVAGADADSFTIGNEDDDRGQLALKKTPDFETKSSYSVTVTATDDENATAELKVTVTVTNAEDGGEVSLTAREPQVDRPVVASLSDEDGTISGASWQWYRNAVAGTATADDDDFTNAPACTDGTLATTLCSIPKATGPSYTPVAADAADDADDGAARLVARVTYTDKHVTDPDNDGDDGDSALAVSQADVQVSDPANTAPKFADDQDPNTAGNQADAMRSVAENEKDASVGDAVTATDADGDKMIYTLGGADAMYFTIGSGLTLNDAGAPDPAPGQIKTAMKLDYEMKSQYMVAVTATDPSGASDSINVMITVTDADDPPTITPDPGTPPNTAPEFASDTASRSVEEGTAAGMDIGDPITATDADADDTLTYSLDEMGDMYFDIDSETGQLMTSAALDDDVMPSHTVTVTADDGNDGTDSIEVTITVTDMQFGCSGPAAADCEALLEAMPKLQGDGSTRSLNWDENTPIADWYGVRKLSESGRVEWLYLHGVSAKEETGREEVKLNGTIAVELSGLTELTRLYLHRNNLTGEIPGELSELTNLVWLRLYDNDLSGGIPDLTGMDSLERLYLHENMLSGDIPMSLGSLSSLTHMLLNRNELSGEIPAMLGDMSGLVWLGLYENDLTGGIPAELGSLSNLERLYLHVNMLTGEVPSELGNLSSLTNLWLKSNAGLSGQLPMSLDSLTNLERVRISGTGFTGCIPAALTASDSTTSDAAMLNLPTC